MEDQDQNVAKATQPNQVAASSKQEKAATVAAVAPVVQAAEVTELERLTIEEKRLAIEFQRAQLEDMRERLDERSLKRDVVRQRSITNGATLQQLRTIDEANQNRCNHRKGGNGLNGYVGGQGDDPQYAVIKHKMSNADLWIRCMRCGKTWKPPIAADFKEPESYTKALADYQAAVNFPTRNVTSSSIVFQFSDGGKFFREQNRDVTLR